MKNLLLISFILFNTLFSCTLHTQPQCTVTYIGNEGFMVETGKKKILVDALFGGFESDWCVKPSAEVIAQMEQAEPPFDNIDIVAITHNHRDHFNADMVASYLLKNPAVTVLCPKQAGADLQQHPDYPKIKNNIVAVTPETCSDTTLDIDGNRIRILRLEHSHYYETDEATGEKRNRHQGVENLGYLFDIDGVKIYHCGDTNPLNEEEYATYKLNEEQIDVALLERLFVAKGEKGVGILEKYIVPKNIVLMHIRPSNVPVFQDFIPKLADRLPNIFIFENPMQQKVYDLN